MQQGLPFNLRILEERDRVAIAYAFEQRAILNAQNTVAEGRFRQQILMTRAYELDAQSIRTELEQFDQRLDMAVITALKSVLATFPLAGGDSDVDTRAPQLPSKQWNLHNKMAFIDIFACR
jgi:hypothetical protein